tara:strand:+ start:246524 stop:246889 length:366 start_codon:yes stop_codon:yes gene_type:complete
MKLLMGLIALVSLNVFAASSQGELMSVENFNSEFNIDKSAVYYPWRTSMTSCHAYTICPNGRRIWCQTYGYAYSGVPSHMNNSCRFGVLPGRAVRCQGYVQQRDIYGRFMWSWVDVPVRCF